MIWLYTPAFVPGSLGEIYIPDLTNEDNDSTTFDWEVKRTFVKLHDPDWVSDIQKPTKVTLRRSMNDTVRTYVTYDPVTMNHHDIVLRFDHLTTNRKEALEQFLLNTEGQNVGYKSPRGNFAACLILNPDVLLTVDHPGDTWDEDGNPIISEWANVELHLRVIKGQLL